MVIFTGHTNIMTFHVNVKTKVYRLILVIFKTEQVSI